MTATVFPKLIARYLTVGTATVEITETGPRDDNGSGGDTVSTCTGCHTVETDGWNTTSYSFADEPIHRSVTEAASNAEARSRQWAQRHAESCRAMPLG
ncbi:hypothetical protein M8Z33_42075 [Streptomyces sp. ZAF1911]|uniref:hypothetical protein n=1 Tax=Streptomyces sp. ZAF1911 TaxID=2944129 RepID=UPI00237AEDC5|nr:hypothetical protein [Streptomyces sp. ZAF1911]MDD9383127.1 hypothetical protein [Streptomyces sp. ZAF1911]